MATTIRNFDGQYIRFDDNKYEYKGIFYGSFETFFNIYANMKRVFPRSKIVYIYLTDSEKQKHIMTNIMKVKLEDCEYAFENDLNVIDKIGLKKDNFYFLNKENFVLNQSEVPEKNQMALDECIKSTKTQYNREVDQKFIGKYNFTLEVQKTEKKP